MDTYQLLLYSEMEQSYEVKRSERKKRKKKGRGRPTKRSKKEQVTCKGWGACGNIRLACVQPNHTSFGSAASRLLLLDLLQQQFQSRLFFSLLTILMITFCSFSGG